MTSFQPLLGFILLCIFNFMLFCISLCIFILYDVDIVVFIAAFGKALCLLCIKHCDTCKNVYYLIREEWYYIYLEAGYHLYCNDGQRHGLSLSSIFVRLPVSPTRVLLKIVPESWVMFFSESIYWSTRLLFWVYFNEVNIYVFT